MLLKNMIRISHTNPLFSLVVHCGGRPRADETLGCSQSTFLYKKINLPQKQDIVQPSLSNHPIVTIEIMLISATRGARGAAGASSRGNARAEMNENNLYMRVAYAPVSDRPPAQCLRRESKYPLSGAIPAQTFFIVMLDYRFNPAHSWHLPVCLSLYLFFISFLSMLLSFFVPVYLIIFWNFLLDIHQLTFLLNKKIKKLQMI
jgi:hypothetical protein